MIFVFSVFTSGTTYSLASKMFVCPSLWYLCFHPKNLRLIQFQFPKISLQLPNSDIM